MRSFARGTRSFIKHFLTTLVSSVHSGRCHRRLGDQGGAGGDQRRQAAPSAAESHGGGGRGQPRGQSQGYLLKPLPVTTPGFSRHSSRSLTQSVFVLPQVIAAEGEMNASRALKEASLVIAESPSALQLRYLQTLNTIAAEKNSTIIFPLPLEMMQGFIKH